MITDQVPGYTPDENKIGVSEFNIYRPYFTQSSRHWFPDGSEFYHHIDFLTASRSPKVNLYRRVISSLIHGYPVIFEKTNSLIIPGAIFHVHTEEPLLMLSYENIPTQHQVDNIVSYWPYNSEGIPEFKKFLLYINKDLTELEVYKNLWRRLEKEYLPYFKKHDIPIMITSSERIMSDNFDDGLNYNERIKSIMDIPILVEEVKQLLPSPDENSNTLAES